MTWGGDEIDVVAADPLQFQHDVRQVLVQNLGTPALVGYRPILAEDAAQVAVGKEDGSRPIPPYQRNLLAVMGLGRVDHDLDGCAADTGFTLQPVDPALPRAQAAFGELSIGLIDALG